jgi:protein gp37
VLPVGGSVEYVTHEAAGPFGGFAEMTPAGPRWTGKVALVPEALDWPLRRRKPLRIFVNSMSDLFHESLSDEVIDRVFAVMKLAQRHTFLVLTKRPARMLAYASALTFERLIACANRSADGGEHRAGAYNLTSIDHLSVKYRHAVLGDKTAYRASPKPPLPNVWIGVSVEDQATADERIPLLLQTPAAHRFISAEPLLGPIDLTRLTMVEPKPPFGPGVWWNSLTGHVAGPDDMLNRLDWVIAGGESGPGARPCDIGWIRSIVGQCKAASVPCFVKQVGRWVLGDDAGFRVNHWLLEDGRGYVPPLIGEPARQRPPTRVCAVPAVGFSLFDRKGGNPAQWPEDLRVREVPA